MTIRLLILSVLSLLPALAQAPAEGADRLPWQTMDHTYCAFTRSSLRTSSRTLPICRSRGKKSA